MSAMTSRERILACMDRRPVDRLPTDYWATGEVNAKLMRHFGVDTMDVVWETLKVDKIRGVGPRYVGPNIGDSAGNPWFFWGVEVREVQYPAGSYFEVSRAPLAEFSTIDEIERGYTWPKADWFDFSTIGAQIERYRDSAIEAGYVAVLYMYQNIRGVEQALLDLVAEPELSRYVIGKIADFLYDYNTRLFEAGAAAAAPIDVTQVTDDYGMQSGLMISPATFDEFFAPQFSRFVRLAKDAGIRVFHHDDGAIDELLPRLVDLDIDVLNPIQWRLPGMDLAHLKVAYGNRVCFHGGIDNQDVLPFGTPAAVRAEVATCVEHLAADGTGYIIAPCHNIQPITPVENIVALYEAAADYGRL